MTRKFRSMQFKQYGNDYDFGNVLDIVCRNFHKPYIYGGSCVLRLFLRITVVPGFQKPKYQLRMSTRLRRLFEGIF